MVWATVCGPPRQRSIQTAGKVLRIKRGTLLQVTNYTGHLHILWLKNERERETMEVTGPETAPGFVHKEAPAKHKEEFLASPHRAGNKPQRLNPGWWLNRVQN